MKLKKGTTSIDVKYNNLKVFPVRPGVTKLVSITKADPKLWFVPQALINHVFQVISKVFYRKLVVKARMVQDKDSAWGVKIQEKPEFYQWVNEQIDQRD